MLKEKVIENLKKNPDSVDMGVFIKSTSDTTCGTVGCLAGHIVMSSDVPLEENEYASLNPKINFELIDNDKFNKWVDFEIGKGCSDRHTIVPAYARYLWAEEYGDEAAEQLPFYDNSWDDIVGFADEQLEDVDGDFDEAFLKLTSKDLIEFLESVGY